MKTSASPGSRILFLLSLVTFAAGCGNSHPLQNVILSPATADARNFPNGQVQFTATGSVNGMPSQPLKSPQIFWCTGTSNGMCAGNIAQGASIDQNGLAQCNANFTGTVTVLAGTSVPSMNPDIGPQLKVFGLARLTCP
jgi:hypothetical protein